MLTYLCKYTPVELMAGFGAQLDSPNEEVPDFSYSDTMIHSSVCGHAKMLITEMKTRRKPSQTSITPSDSGDTEGAAGTAAKKNECHICDPTRSELILTNCCDSIRRVYDTVEDGDFDFADMLDLPHRNTGHAVEQYAAELRRLTDTYAKSTGRAFSREAFLAAWRKNADTWVKFFGDNSEPFLLLLGARTGDLLSVKLRDGLSYPVLDLTCGGVRSVPKPPKDADTLTMPALLSAYAEALLSQIPCMRMEDIRDRAALLRQKGLIGIVYHSIRFCDYYPFEYAEIRRSTDLPILKLESDYTDQSAGQLSTRITAFDESLKEMRHENANTKEPGKETEMPANPLFVGIDSGSTTTNIAAVDRDGKLVESHIVRTGAKASSAAERALADLKKKLGSRAADIACITATGYGREFISFADQTKTEISCHARGAHAEAPETRTIIDIGGQDSKVICLDEDGNIVNFIMNDKCAAGTGRFLEMMATTLEMSLDQMAKTGLSWKKNLTISSTCTVFAESEVVSLIAESNDTGDIVHALNKSVAGKTAAMVRRSRGEGPYMMTGGVARNPGVAQEIERHLDAKLFITPHPDLTGAIGAALYARDAMVK